MRAQLGFVVLAIVAGAARASWGWDNCTEHFPDYNRLPGQVPGAVQVCSQGHIAISYDVTMKTVGFSAYYVTPADCNNNIPDRDSFYEDPDLKEHGIDQAKVDSHAFNETWNRGHCAPSMMMSYSESGKKSCYTMANIAPQEGRFNQRQWAELERHTFDWVKANSPLYIITGVAYSDRGRPKRSTDGVGFPDYYFKVMCDISAGKSVGFVGSNHIDTEGDGTTDMKTVDDVASNYLGMGALFPSDLCNTGAVDPSHWWTNGTIARHPAARRRV